MCKERKWCHQNFRRLITAAVPDMHGKKRVCIVHLFLYCLAVRTITRTPWFPSSVGTSTVKSAGCRLWAARSSAQSARTSLPLATSGRYSSEVREPGTGCVFVCTTLPCHHGNPRQEHLIGHVILFCYYLDHFNSAVSAFFFNT